MLSVDEAQQRVLELITPLPAEGVPIGEAWGRALAEEVRAAEDVPPFRNSAMDGYAVRAAETRGARSEAPVRRRVSGDLPAGRVADAPLAQGSALRIMTGAPLPEGADAVVMVEYTRRAGDDEVVIEREVRPGENVREAGEDMRAGEPVIAAGAWLRPAHVGVCAAAGLAQVRVFGVPRVAVVSTGDEVVEPGVPLPPGKIRDSNLYTLSAQVREAGARLHSARHVPDDAEALRLALREATEADLVVTSGGVSVGDYDLVKDVLAQEGDIEFWRVAMKPGKPLTFGRVRGKPLLGLPGNPVSSLITFELFARPALRKMMGQQALFRPQVTTTLREPIRHRRGRREFIRAVTTLGEGGWESRSAGAQGSGILTAVTRANSLVVIPEENDDVEAGQMLTAMLLWEGDGGSV